MAKQLGSFTLESVDVIRELLEVFEPHPHDDEAAADRATMEYLYSGKEFFDDISNKWLEKNRAIEARRFELDFSEKKHVYTQTCLGRRQAATRCYTMD